MRASILRRVRTLVGVAAVSTVCATSHAQGSWVGYWTAWTSEESGPIWCNAWDEAAIGFACSGRYCDNVSLLCNTLPSGIALDSSTDYWTAWFSEEDPWGGVAGYDGGWYDPDRPYDEVCFEHNGGLCPSPGCSGPPSGMVSGIQCSGSYCDSVSLECDGARRPDGTWAHMSNCSWSTSWFSEEQGAVAFGSARFIAGIRCNGSYCDNKKFYVCNVE